MNIIKSFESFGKETILCSAFPGTGKSHYFKNTDKHTLDSDSSTFDKSQFPDNYIKHIKENMGKVDIIFISSHDVVREALVDNNLPFILVYPDISLKEEFIERYKQRGSNEGFINLLNQNWENWVEELEQQQGCEKIVLQSGQYISDVLK